MRLVIFGLGRIGLPISLVCADSGIHVTGLDINEKRISNLKKGKIAFHEPDMQKLLDRNLNKNFFPKSQKEDIKHDMQKAEYFMLAVGTGFAKYPEKPKLSVLYSIIGQLINAGVKNKTIILRVTIPIGTSEEIISLIERKTGLKEGQDFWFAFVPERIMEGKAVNEESSLPKIVGANSDQGFEKVKNFFEKIGGDIVRVSNPRTAEFIKLVDNSWRNTRFAFANELAYLAEENKIDVIEAIKSANQGYKRNQIPQPGPVSGYCLGKDPYLLEIAFEKIAEKRGFNSVWYYGRRANDWLVEKTMREIQGENILVAGLSFKEDIDDYRFSYAAELLEALLSKGYNVRVSDPFLDDCYYTELPDEIKMRVKGFKSLSDALNKDVDTIVFTTRHEEYKNIDLKKLLKKKNVKSDLKVIDLWNMFQGKKLPDKVNYKGFGIR